MHCTKAIIAVAGYGTRMLPITKALEKCMLPVGNRPVIDYIVEDCLRAGINEFICIVGEEFGQIKRFYGHNQLLEDYLADKGKSAELAEITQLKQKARFHYVVQDQYQPYGTNTPVWLARHLVKPHEHVLVMFGDQFFWRPDGGSEIADFLSAAQAAKAPSAMLANEVPWENTSHYGIVVTKTTRGQELYKKIIEKPPQGTAPSNLSNAGCFLVGTDIFPYVDHVAETTKKGEHYFIDAVNAFVQDGHPMHVFRATGEYLDCGTTAGWLHANNRVVIPPQNKM